MQGQVAGPEELESKYKEMEKELRQYQFMLESAYDAIFLKDLKSRYIIVNKKTLEAFGVSREEVIGKNDYELMPNQEEAKKNVEDDQLVFRTGKLTEIIKHMTAANGERRWLQVIKVPLFDNNGRVIGLVGIARDITDHTKMEEELHVAVKKFKDLTETTTDWIWEVNKDGVYTYVSPKVKELLGYEVSEVLGKTPFDLMPKEEAERVGKIFKEKVINREPFYKLENVNLHKDGYLVVLETNGISIFDEKGQLNGYRGIDRDITERKKAEEEIKSSRRKLEILINSSNDIIFLKDKNFRYLIANRIHEELFNIELENIIGKTDFDFMPRETAERCRKSDMDALKSKDPIEREEFVGGRCFHVVKHRVADTKGEIIGIAAVIRDITERKKTEETLKESELKLMEQKLTLEQKNIALGEVIGQIEVEKNKVKDDIATNINEILFPILAKLKVEGANCKYIDLLQHHLEELTSSFGRKIAEKSVKLTSREIEICSMIKGGLTSKEISELLNISHQTVEKHRKNIRCKIGISNKDVNLFSFLHKL